jgi:uncharacterized protein with HEPN domain
MSPDKSALLQDILHACNKIAGHLEGVTYPAFLGDTKSLDAVLFEILVLGEAVKALPQEWTEQHPHVPWSRIARMRDRLIHGYRSINIDTVWETATSDVPALAAEIQKILAQE